MWAVVVVQAVETSFRMLITRGFIRPLPNGEVRDAMLAVLLAHDCPIHALYVRRQCVGYVPTGLLLFDVDCLTVDQLRHECVLQGVPYKKYNVKDHLYGNLCDTM